MSFEGFPLIVGWELTLKCNLRCRHCGSSAGQPRARELTTQEALNICDQLPSLLVQEVDLTGGEPLLRPDWAIIAGRLIQSGISVNVLTNGWDVENDTVSRLKDVGVSAVGVSLDGLAESHDALRNRRGSFEAVLRTIALLQEQGLSLHVITTANPTNLHEMPELLALLVSLGVEHWRLQPVIVSGRVLSHPELRMGDAAILALGRFIRTHTLSARSQGLQILCSDGLEYVQDDLIAERPWRGCSAGLAACGIASDGKVKGCLSMPDQVAEGDLRETSLWEVWFDPDKFPYTRKFTHSQLGTNCAMCDKGLLCKGGCSSSSYCSTGEFHNDFPCFYRANAATRNASAGPAALHQIAE